jgi:hypothetical protein
MTLMSEKITWSLLTLPIELMYGILDHLDELTILISVRDVCSRLNTITDTYHRYKVTFNFIFAISFISTKNDFPSQNFFESFDDLSIFCSIVKEKEKLNSMHVENDKRSEWYKDSSNILTSIEWL